MKSAEKREALVVLKSVLLDDTTKLMGMCEARIKCTSKGLINERQNLFLKNLIYDAAPRKTFEIDNSVRSSEEFARSGHGFYWPKSDLRSRLNWIDKMIKSIDVKIRRIITLDDGSRFQEIFDGERAISKDYLYIDGKHYQSIV